MVIELLLFAYNSICPVSRQLGIELCTLCQLETANEKHFTDQLNELTKQLDAANIQLGLYLFRLMGVTFPSIST